MDTTQQTTSFLPSKPGAPSAPPMAVGFQTSFIPKKSLVENDAVKPANKMTLALVSISVVVFIGGVVLAGLSYTYKQKVVAQVADLEQKIEQRKKEYDPNLIADLEAYQRRSDSVAKILSNHITVTPVLESLAELTLKTVQFKDFSYKVSTAKSGDSPSPSLPGNTKGITVSMTGTARGYKTIVLQNEMLEKNPFFKNIIFSGISPEQKSANIGFKLSFDVDPVFVSYARMLERRREYAGTFGGRVLNQKNTEPAPINLMVEQVVPQN